MPLTLPTARDLRANRQRLGLTQAELADEAGVSQPLIARIENENVDPRFSTVKAIVEALNRYERQEVTVEEVMTTDVVRAEAGAEVREAIVAMREHGYSQLPVLEEGHPVGSLTESEVVHELSTAGDPEALAGEAVREIMGPPFPTAEPDTTVDEAYSILEDAGALLVMEKGEVVGIVAKADLLSLL
jgi:predicted transcriptional regulator